MKVFKILDLYIIRKFLGSYFFSIVLILAITIVIDTNEKLDAFMKAPLRAIVFDYFLNFLPYFANLFSPLFTFIAVIFFTSKLAENSEIIAILSSGVSFKRLFIPYMFSAAVIAALNIVLSCYIIPPSNITRIEFTNTYVRNKRVDYASNIQLQNNSPILSRWLLDGSVISRKPTDTYNVKRTGVVTIVFEGYNPDGTLVDKELQVSVDVLAE